MLAAKNGASDSSKRPSLAGKDIAVDKSRPTFPGENTLPPKFKKGFGIEFVLVPKGKSWLGGGGGKLGDKEVEVPHDFYLGQIHGYAGAMAERNGQ